MKHKIQLRFTGLFGILAVFNPSQTMLGAGATDSSPSLPAQASALAPADAPALSREESLRIIAEARHYVAHPQPQSPSQPQLPSQPTNGSLVTTPDFDMAEPPPAPRAETKPPAPAPNLVWVPGHYMPVKKVWRWVTGEWAVPATPISIWIPAHYNSTEKRWAPGYWQPDATSTPTADSPQNPTTPPAAVPAP